MKTPIFAAPPKRQGLTARGFTLVELLVVLGIAGLLIALAPTAYDRARQAAEYRSTIRHLGADLRAARLSAQTTGAWVAVAFDLAHRQYQAGPASLRRTIPSDLQLRVITAEGLVQSAEAASLYFFPDGGSTGGSIEIIRPNGAGTRWRIDWLTGQVTQEPLLP